MSLPVRIPNVGGGEKAARLPDPRPQTRRLGPLFVALVQQPANRLTLNRCSASSQVRSRLSRAAAALWLRRPVRLLVVLGIVLAEVAPKIDPLKLPGPG